MFTTAASPRQAEGTAGSHQRESSNDSSGRSQRSSSHGSAASIPSMRGDLPSVEDSPDTTGAKRRRSSATGSSRPAHNGLPLVPTMQAASANFWRSWPNNVGASTFNVSVAGSSSLSAALGDVSPAVVASPHGPHQLASISTSGQPSPYGTSSSVHNSSGSIVSSGYRRRHPSFEPFDTSASDVTQSWPYSPASTVPPTPNSLNGATFLPSVHSDSPPVLGLMLREFSPEIHPTDEDVGESPPLTPDRAGSEEAPRNGMRPRSHSSSHVIGRSYGGLGMSTEAAQSSRSVPNLDGLEWPAELFGSDGPQFLRTNISNDEPAGTANAVVGRPSAGTSSRSRSPSGSAPVF
ncbi:hypothetical protein ONZ51_g7847 [Trametes cubensis]|uniref:Uncharacterized protein n=1 Tax=Trametes cubensis TaxID=1111947 RepID=A0AAD7TRV2_9APHY|nr:hypothetical protein ONZ51_g7847 [Trametes cubensis]